MTTDTPLTNMFLREPEDAPRIETQHRRIRTQIPAPETVGHLRQASDVFPRVNCYQPPIVWDSADGFTVRDPVGNQWIDFTSTAVMANTGHGHPTIRNAVGRHVERGLMANFSFPSDIRAELARRLIEIAPPGCEKVWFWTVGSEAIECAFRLAREWGTRDCPDRFHILTHRNDYHGWTLGAHQVSGESAAKPWLTTPDSAIHHIPFPRTEDDDDTDWSTFFANSLAQLDADGVSHEQICAVFIETFQGWGALPLPASYVHSVRRWADDNDVLLIFDEVQTGFGRTGRWFGHEHYDARADLLCVGKGLTSSLPLAAVLGPSEVLDLLPPGEVTTTHAAHPVSCAAAIANLDVLRNENLVAESDRRGKIAAGEIERLRTRFPRYIGETTGHGLLRAIHVVDPTTGAPSCTLARDWTWSAVKHGVMLFYTNRSTLKVCPPLVISDDALVEGIRTLGDALEAIA